MPEYPNPYVWGEPVRTAEMFFGRKNELVEIENFLRGDQSVALVGPPKIGKTSLLFHLRRPAAAGESGLEPSRLVSYLDGGRLGEASPPEAFRKIAAELGREMESRSLPEEAELRKACLSPSRLAFEGAVRALNRRGLRIVIILDGFEPVAANPRLDVQFFNALRSAAGRFRLAYLIASENPLIALTYSGPPREIHSSPFFNIFATQVLGLLPEADARDLIRAPARNAGRPFPPDLENFLFQLGGRHPLILQTACFHAWEHPQDRGRIKERTAASLRPFFERIWRNLTEPERRILRGAGGEPVSPSPSGPEAAVLRGLEQKCVLLASHGIYEHSAKAWADFLASQPP